MDEFYRPAESRVSAAIAFVVVVYSARKVVGDAGIYRLVAALDYVDAPGHRRQEDRNRERNVLLPIPTLTRIVKHLFKTILIKT